MDASKIFAGARDTLKAVGLHIQPSCAEDWIEVSKDARASDRGHAKLFGEQVRPAIMKAYLGSKAAWTVVSDETGEVLGVFAVADGDPYVVGELSGSAAGLVGRPALDEHLQRQPARAVVKAFKEIAERLLRRYGPFMGFLPKEDSKLLRFATMLGAMPFTYENRAFGWHLKLGG